MENAGGIRETVLRQLIGAAVGGIAATACGRKSGFALAVQVGSSKKTLTTSRGATRLFASLDTLGTFVKGLGLERFDVDLTEHQPGRLRGARPDRAAALRYSRTLLRQQELELRT